MGNRRTKLHSPVFITFFFLRGRLVFLTPLTFEIKIIRYESQGIWKTRDWKTRAAVKIRRKDNSLLRLWKLINHYFAPLHLWGSTYYSSFLAFSFPFSSSWCQTVNLEHVFLWECIKNFQNFYLCHLCLANSGSVAYLLPAMSTVSSALYPTPIDVGLFHYFPPNLFLAFSRVALKNH